RVDWDCEVLKNYSEINLGCKKRVSSGIDWVFDNVEEAIFLEDDTLPHPTFFRFCEEMLDYYRHDSRITTISGDNLQFGQKRSEYSYFFSRYPVMWGWASWRRAWQHYDVEMKFWPEVKAKHLLRDILIDPEAVKDWIGIFDSTYDDQIPTWDFQWTLACWLQNGLSITPNVNLVSNIGFGQESTNTTENNSRHSNIPRQAIEFPLKHPQFMIRDTQADKFTQRTYYNYLSFLKRISAKIEQILQLWS
ncbi:MAG: glycosyltransferase family 2 protein, partial [Waterburya sp.]